jgi:DNA adenine methylase
MQAPGIVEILGPHQAYWGLCAGSTSVLFAKPRSRQEVVVDLDGLVTNLARVVQDDQLSLKLFDRVERTAFCEEIYQDSVLWLQMQETNLANEKVMLRLCSSVEFDLDLAYHYFVVCWMSKGGFAGTTRELDIGIAKRFTSNGGDPATRFRNAGRSIPCWWERLQGVTVLCGEMFGVLPKIEDKKGTVVEVDPPYFEKSANYKHDFTVGEADANDEWVRKYGDHGRLARALQRFRQTRIVVEYYEWGGIQELYLDQGFRKIDRTTTKQLGNGKNEAREVLLVKN